MSSLWPVLVLMCVTYREKVGVMFSGLPIEKQDRSNPNFSPHFIHFLQPSSIYPHRVPVLKLKIGLVCIRPCVRSLQDGAGTSMVLGPIW
jgi:hypothetical protein